MNPAVRVVAMSLVALAGLFTSHAARAIASGDIVVIDAKGDARLSHRGTERQLRKGQVVLLPSTVRTGGAGTADLRQGATTLHIAPDTVLEFPEMHERGEPVERIVQTRGSAFYDVGKRDGRKLRVETPYLVAVIKGTQFSVAVREDGTSISLVEGSLEILTPDGSALVNLEAGEIATRSTGDRDITVIAGDAPRVRTPLAPAGGAVAAVDASPRGGGADAVAVVGASVSGDDVDASVAVSTDRSPGVVDVGVDVVAGTGGVAVEVGAGARVDAGPVSVDVGGGASVDLGVEPGAAPSVAVDAGVDASVGAGVVDVAAGASVGADLGSGSVDVGLDVGGVGLDIGLDLGLNDEEDTSVDTDTTEETDDTAPDTNIVEDVGGLLNGLLGRPGKP